jgi:hypothetical protein
MAAIISSSRKRTAIAKHPGEMTEYLREMEITMSSGI